MGLPTMTQIAQEIIYMIENGDIAHWSDAHDKAVIAALRAQPDYGDPFPVTGNPATPHRELIAELRKPMHYLSMAKRNRAADALEGKP